MYLDLLHNPEFREDKLDLAKEQMYTGIARRNDDVGIHRASRKPDSRLTARTILTRACRSTPRWLRSRGKIC